MEKDDDKLNILEEDNILAGLNILLVDNGSSSLDDYYILLKGYNVEKVFFQDISNFEFESYHLVILSDGRALSVDKNIKELEFVRKTSIPVIGICYGFQVLCLAHEAELMRLSNKRTGLVEIIPENSHCIFDGKKSFFVFEKHRYAVDDLSSKLVCLARSEDGCEIIQVRGKKQFGLQFHPENNNPPNQGGDIFNNILKFIFVNV